MAPNGLKSIADIFERRIFRIPDYQRGYAWEKDQLNDFWDDLKNIPEDKFHYTGVLTLEKVDKSIYEGWQDDNWLINGKGHTPFFLVDGQQRLTTIIILLQVILEKMKENDTLNYDLKKDIFSKYIFQSKDQGVSKSYIFGYERDNPSYEFLKTKIFNEQSNANQDIETLYTANLENCKKFFTSVLGDEKDELALLYKKITQLLKFNVYEVGDDLDVFVAFETMNNRGKSLSKLELLKNRLIYSSTLLKSDLNEKNTLRRNINESWKTVYEYLGKNKNIPLDDDKFLKNHWIMCFRFAKHISDEYSKFLLDEHFTSKNVLNGKIKSISIQEYITSVQESVKCWYEIFNPEHSELPDDLKLWLNKLNRLGFGAFAPLIMAVLQKETSSEKILALLKSIERYIFVMFLISQRNSNKGDQEFYRSASDYHKGNKKLDEIIAKINDWTSSYFSEDQFFVYIKDKFCLGEKNGYYGWNGLKYFLFEYDLYLRENSKSNQIKINWNIYDKNKGDFVSIEHIFPQEGNKKCWNKNFKQFNDEQKKFLCNSLGNLLPLSKRKNSSLQNDCFSDKKIQKNGSVGYFNGSYSENEVAKNADWTPHDILDRGLLLLSFLEKRWNIDLGDDNNKKRLLYLEFLENKKLRKK